MHIMQVSKLKLTKMGNSRGVRVPASVIRRYGFGEDVAVEFREEGLLLKPSKPGTAKLSWEDTAKAMAMANAGEDWSDWAVTEGDGLDSIPWQKARK
jgi:antitoxin MazE